MTKPIIQQLAERIGWPPGNAKLEAIAAAHAAPSFIFELCAYLDERDQSDPIHAWCAVCGASEKAPYPRRNWTSDNVFRACCDGCWKALQLSAASKHLTRAGQKRPPPPDELVGALHDPIHPPSGNLISASPVRVKRRPLSDLLMATCGQGYKFNGERYYCKLPSGHGGPHTDEPPAAPEVACDHHAAIHELNRELVEAREALAMMKAERDCRIADCDGREAELAKVTAERDELKTELAWEKAWDLHTKVAMGAVVEAARYVVRLHHHPSGQQAAENAFASLMLRLDELDDLIAAAAKPPEP